GLGRVRQRERARMARLQRQVAEDHARAFGPQALVRDRAVGAREVGVDHHEAPVTADVVVLADARHLGAAQVLHADSLAAMEGLEAGGIRIRRLRDGDARAFAAGTGDPDVVAHAGITRITAADARAWFATCDEAGVLQRAIAGAATDAFIGTVILFNIALHER